MGKGIITSGGDDGLYNVELAFHRERIDATIAIIDAQIAALDAKISEIGTEIFILSIVIWAMPEGNEKEKKKKELQVLVDKKDLEELKRASYQKRKDYLQDNMPEDPTVSAWCGDLTEDLSGNVGTIEIPGERGIVQIQPGYESNAVYNKTRDAQLQPAIAGTPESTCYNLAMLPGWQKWMPTYRHGIISNIDTDNDTCDVMFYADKSSQQGLSINQESKLSGISIEYMSCNASAFEDGDNVLVKFESQEWSGAKVVGFKDNPKACCIDGTPGFFRPDTFADDGRWASSHFDNAGYLAFGFSPAYGLMNVWVTFKDISVCPNTEILSTVATFYSPYTSGPEAKDISVNIYGNYIDNPVNPTNVGEAGALVLTTNNVKWVVPRWDAHGYYSTPDISSIIQEIVDKDGWAKNNNIMLIFKTTSGGSSRTAGNYGSGYSPNAEIIW